MSTAVFDVIDELLGWVGDALTPEVARRILDFQFDEATHRRLDAWAEKANEGQLTPNERAEYHDYVELIDRIALLQAKARRTLKQARA